MRRVSLPAESVRGGILSHGSFLLVTSNPTRTSPVKRGLFVLDNLLGTPPPPPPPEVPSLDEAPRGGDAGPRTVRAQLEATARNRPAPAATPAWTPSGSRSRGSTPSAARARTSRGSPSTQRQAGHRRKIQRGPRAARDAGLPPGGVLPDLTRKLMVFALGRGLSPADECTVDDARGAVARRGRQADDLAGGHRREPCVPDAEGENVHEPLAGRSSRFGRKPSCVGWARRWPCPPGRRAERPGKLPPCAWPSSASPTACTCSAGDRWGSGATSSSAPPSRRWRPSSGRSRSSPDSPSATPTRSAMGPGITPGPTPPS